MESISAWLAARVTVGQGNLAGWHPLVSLCLSCWAISASISKVYLKQTSAADAKKPLSSLLWDAQTGLQLKWNKVGMLWAVVKFDLAFTNNLLGKKGTKGRVIQAFFLMSFQFTSRKVYIYIFRFQQEIKHWTFHLLNKQVCPADCFCTLEGSSKANPRQRFEEM